MRAEFYRPGEPDEVVGVARWDGRRAQVESADDEVRGLLARIFRPAPLVLDDPGLLPQGSRGPVVLEPGSLRWFRGAALHRAAEASLVARIVPEVAAEAGWDPASAYRTFTETVDLIVRSASATSGPEG